MQEQHRPVKEQAKALHNSAIQPTESKLSKSPSKMDHGSVNNSVLLKNSNDEIPRNMLYDQSKYSRISDNDITRDENTKVDVEQIEDDEREHRVTSYSYDFEQKDGDASLKKLLSMSNTLGYSHKQQKMLRQKQMELEQAEKKLQRQQRLQGKPTVHDGGSANNTSGVFLVPEKTKLAKKSKYHDQQGSRNFSQTEKKPSKEFKRMPKLQAISEQKRRRPPPPAGVENEENVKDYFDNKISLRRSIEKKLHYDSKQTQK